MMRTRRISTGVAAGFAVLALAVSPAAAQSSSQTTQRSGTGSPGARPEPGGMDQRSSQRQPGAWSSAGQQTYRASAVEDRVYLRLAERAWAGADFKVSAERDGTIILSGTVPNDESRQRMLRIARRTPGVRDVRDQMRVDPASGQQANAATTPDRELSKRVAEKIASAIGGGAKAGEDWWFTGWRVEGPDNDWNLVVESEQGRINLDGEVPRPELMRKAVEAALDVQGVRSVRSDLEVDRDYYTAYRTRPFGWDPYYGRAYDPYYRYEPYGYFPYGYAYGYHPWGYYDGHGGDYRLGRYGEAADIGRTADNQDASETQSAGADQGSMSDQHAGTSQSTAADRDFASDQHAGKMQDAADDRGTADRQPAASAQSAEDAFASMKGEHNVTGEVASVDHQSGKVAVKTDTGTLDLHFPPSSIQGLQQGDRIDVELGFRKVAERAGG
jgi:osmotically-inducible protein OsmY